MMGRSSSFRRLIQFHVAAEGYGKKIGAVPYTARAASTAHLCDPCSPVDDELVDINWENLGFGLMRTDYMYVMKCGKDEHFQRGQLSRYGNIELSPSAGVLNYGQGLFEGTKAYRREDGGIFIFRPQENAIRMQIGAERMCMRSPSIHQFVNAVKQTALSNRRWIPPAGKGSLYIRPLLIGSGPVLGLAPSPEYTFLVYASPVGNYFKEGTAPLKLYVEDEFHRATRGGAGGVKSITNYAPVLRAIRRARDRGFSDVLYLNSVNKQNIEEVSSCNVFIVKGNIISTPAPNGTILEGVTRKSIMDIASDLGYLVKTTFNFPRKIDSFIIDRRITLIRLSLERGSIRRMSKEEADKGNSDNPWPHRNDGYREKEEDMKLWGILIFGLIGATATTFAVTQLRRTANWVYSQLSRSQSSQRGGHSFRTSFQEEAWKRYNRRMQEEYEEEIARVERIRRMQSVFNRERNKFKRTYENWQENSQGAYHQHSQRNDWYWTADTSFRDYGSNFRETPRVSAKSPLSHHYSVLGLDRRRTNPYTDEEIKSAFRVKAKEFHPDQNQDKKEFAEAKFKEVMVSYEAIKEERKNNKQ